MKMSKVRASNFALIFFVSFDGKQREPFKATNEIIQKPNRF